MTRARSRPASERQAELRAEFGTLYDAVASILFEADLAGVNFGTNTDEYEPETGTILPRVAGCRTDQEVQLVLHEEFVRWFGPDTAGPFDRYAEVAGTIWAELDRRRVR